MCKRIHAEHFFHVRLFQYHYFTSIIFVPHHQPCILECLGYFQEHQDNKVVLCCGLLLDTVVHSQRFKNNMQNCMAIDLTKAS